jgi:vacuolar protein sorting-associated protein 13A/C
VHEQWLTLRIVSQFVSFEAPSAETAFSLPPQGQNPEEVNVGLSWTEGSGKYKLSKVVTLVPRFFVKNNLSEPLCFREYSAPPRTQWTLQPGERQGLTFMRPTNDKLLTLAFAGLNAEWWEESNTSM